MSEAGSGSASSRSTGSSPRAARSWIACSRGETVARALVGVVELAGELLDKRVGLGGQRQGAAGVLARGVPRGVAEQTRACVGEPLAGCHVDVAAAQPVAELLERAHRVRRALDPAGLGLDQPLPWPRDEPRWQDLRRQLPPTFAELQRGERFEDRLATVGGMELDRVQQQREVTAYARVAAGHQFARAIIRRAGQAPDRCDRGREALALHGREHGIAKRLGGRVVEQNAARAREGASGVIDRFAVAEPLALAGGRGAEQQIAVEAVEVLKRVVLAALCGGDRERHQRREAPRLAQIGQLAAALALSRSTYSSRQQNGSLRYPRSCSAR